MPYRLSALFCTLLHTSLLCQSFKPSEWTLQRETEREKREVLLGVLEVHKQSRIWEKAHQWAQPKRSSPVVSQLPSLLDAAHDQYILTSELCLRSSHTVRPKNNIHNSSTRTMFNTNRIQDHCQSHLITSVHTLIKHTAAWMSHKPSQSASAFFLHQWGFTRRILQFSLIVELKSSCLPKVHTYTLIWFYNKFRKTDNFL